MITPDKKVLLIIIDAMASRVVRPAIERGELPHLEALAAAGSVDWKCTAIFPSITPAATAALITGGYPSETGIAGAYFYDCDEDRVHYYGDDAWPIMKRGLASFFQEFLVELNGRHLKKETAYQTVERAGGQAACLNYLWFRGDVPHQIHVPWLLRLWPGIPWSKTVEGPSLLSLGDFVSTPLDDHGAELGGPGGLFRRYGFTDQTTAASLLALAENRAWPQFTVAYFPDNDFVSHEEGPRAALRTVHEVDRTLGQVIERCGGLDRMLQELSIVVTGDHAQSDLTEPEKVTGIDLDQVLADYSIVPAGENWRDGDDLMICPNMRSAQIYLRAGYWERREQIVQRLLEDERIDQVIWREGESHENPRYLVRTRDRGQLEFIAVADDEQAKSADTFRYGEDEYGGRWGWRGRLEAVAGHVRSDAKLNFGDYPNAFERIAMAFDEQVTGDLWVTSRLGFEFRLPNTGTHRRGSHGSLHVDDSHSPLIMAGVPGELLPRATPRSVDVTPLCLSILGLEGSRAVGASHAQRVAC